MTQSTGKQDAICPICQTLNAHFESFCRNCGSPISATATLDPVNTIEAEGFLFRKALDQPPSLIVVIGIWILFMPAGVASTFLAIYLILNRQGLANFVFFWAFVALSCMAFVVLYRITKKYLVTRR